MSISRLLFQCSTKKIQLKCVDQVESGHHHNHFIEHNLFLPWYSWKIAHLVFNKQILTQTWLIDWCLMSTLAVFQLYWDVLIQTGSILLFYYWELIQIWLCFSKRNLNSDGQQFHQYQQNKQPPLTSDFLKS